MKYNINEYVKPHFVHSKHTRSFPYSILPTWIMSGVRIYCYHGQLDIVCYGLWQLSQADSLHFYHVTDYNYSKHVQIASCEVNAFAYLVTSSHNFFQSTVHEGKLSSCLQAETNHGCYRWLSGCYKGSWSWHGCVEIFKLNWRVRHCRIPFSSQTDSRTLL